MPVTRRPTTSVPVPQPRPDTAASRPAATTVPTPQPRPSGWQPAQPAPVDLAPPARGAPQATGTGQRPGPDLQASASSALDSLRALAPSGITSADPLQLLDGVKDGQATITIPLNAGHYRSGRVGFDVAPGTVARVQVEVRDGRLVPAVDADGRAVGHGTRVEVDPPIDLPLWLTGRGAYLQDRGQAQAAFRADIGGFFDLQVQRLNSTKLTDVVRGLSAPAADTRQSRRQQRQDSSQTNLPQNLLGLTQTRFEGNVSLRDNVLNAGPATVDLAPGSRVTVSGDVRTATLSGQLNVDGATLRQGDDSVRLGAGSLQFSSQYQRGENGELGVSTRVSNIAARVDEASFRRPSSPQDTDPDRVDITSAQLRNGEVTIDATLRPRANAVLPELTASSFALRGDAEGSIAGAKLTARDQDGTARIGVGPGRFSGRIEVDPSGTSLDGTVSNTSLEVRDLDTSVGSNAFGLESGRLDGDVRLSTNSRTGAFDVNVDAKRIDVTVNGFQNTGGDNVIDLSRFQATGSGTVRFSNDRGVQIDGDILVDGTVNDLRIGDAIDLGRGSTVSGRGTHLAAGGPQGFELNVTTAVDARVDNFRATSGGASIEGQGRIRGNAQLELRDGDVNLVVTRATANVNVSDARFGSASSPLALDVARGSTANLNVQNARFTSQASGIEGSVRLGPGSVLDATLDSGHLTAGGRRIDLQAGSRARFELSSLAAGSNQDASLRGNLSVDAALRTSDLQGLNLGGVTVRPTGSVSGRVSLDVPDVTLATDGRVTYQDAAVALDARVGNVQASRITPASAPVPGLLSEQQVRGTTAAAIADAPNIPRNGQLNPLDVARRMQNGTIELSVPVEGTLGQMVSTRGGPRPGLASATFAPGTTLRLQLQVQDGRLVPGQTRASFSQPGDGPAWVTARGAYLNQNNSLTLDLGGFPDMEVPGMERLPLDVDSLVTRLAGAARGSSSSGAGGAPNPIQLNRAQLNITNATFSGPLAVPGGFVNVGPQTRISVRGSFTDATVTGRLQLNNVDIANDGIALRGNQGSADLNVQYRNGVATSTLSNINLETQYAVQRRSNGDYINLADGRVSGGRLVVALPVDASRGTAGAPTSTTLDLPQFSGTIQGGRITTNVNGRAAKVEIGRAQVNGSIRVDNASIAVRGSVQEADVVVRNLRASSAAGSANVEAARIRGSGTVDFSTAGGVSFDANVTSLDVNAARASGRGAGSSATAGRTRITGNGRVAWNQTNGLTLEGNLSVDTTVSGQTSTASARTVRARRGR